MKSSGNDKTSMKHIFHLISERGLDTLNLCGIRGKLSQGVLEPQREYQCSNGETITLHRPCIAGKHEEITQLDLDILRAITTHYVEENKIFPPFSKPDPSRWIEESSPDAQRKTVDTSELYDLWLDESAIAINITPEQIRRRLWINNKKLSTQRITHALLRLSEMKVEGNYSVRTKKGAIPVPISGTLLSFESAPGDSTCIQYMIYFATQWGRLYLNNVQWGNLTHINDRQYIGLKDGSKNILLTVAAFESSVFQRKDPNRMLEYYHIKVGKNRRRALATLEKFLEELRKAGYIEWEKLDQGYKITRLVDFTRVGRGAIEVNETEHDQDMESQEPTVFASPSVNEREYSEDGLNNIIAQIRTKKNKSREEQALSEIWDTVELLHRQLPKIKHPDLAVRVKLRKIEQDWQEYSPYYLWTVDWFREKYVHQIKNYSCIDRIETCFREIDADINLQNTIRQWVDYLERSFMIPANQFDFE